MLTASSITSTAPSINSCSSRSNPRLIVPRRRKWRANWQPNKPAAPMNKGVAAFAHQGLFGQKYATPAPLTDTW
ncbi:hypothetical protein D3C75_1213680 [compost metagenome]